MDLNIIPRPRYAYELNPAHSTYHARYDIVDYHQEVSKRVLASVCPLEFAQRIVEALNKYEWDNANPPGTYAHRATIVRPGG